MTEIHRYYFESKGLLRVVLTPFRDAMQAGHALTASGCSHLSEALEISWDFWRFEV